VITIVPRDCFITPDPRRTALENIEGLTFEEVRVITLDEVIEQETIDRVDVIKIDTGGRKNWC
jgi:FkbM family methyltransferase